MLGGPHDRRRPCHQPTKNTQPNPPRRATRQPVRGLDLNCGRAGVTRVPVAVLPCRATVAVTTRRLTEGFTCARRYESRL